MRGKLLTVGILSSICTLAQAFGGSNAFSRHGSSTRRNTALNMVASRPVSTLLQATIEVNKCIDEHKLLLFTKASDGQSQRVKALLADSGLEFINVDMDTLPHGKMMEEALKQLTGRWQTPYVYIGHKYIGGHDHILTMNVSGYLGEIVKTINEFERDSDDVWRDSAPRSF